MLTHYRKKPVVIEAFQMTEARRRDHADWPEWLHRAWNREPGAGVLFVDADDPSGHRLVIGTLEGVHRVSWDDWIVRGVKGELYAVKPDIFEATYESASWPMQRELVHYYVRPSALRTAPSEQGFTLAVVKADDVAARQAHALTGSI